MYIPKKYYRIQILCERIVLVYRTVSHVTENIILLLLRDVQLCHFSHECFNDKKI